MCRGHDWLTEPSMSVLPSFTLSWGATPASPRWCDRCSVCGWVHVCSLTCASHVRIRTKPRLLPCVTFCYISSCCAARVTRSVDPGVNIRRHPPPKKRDNEFIKIITSLPFPPLLFTNIFWAFSITCCVRLFIFIYICKGHGVSEYKI